MNDNLEEKLYTTEDLAEMLGLSIVTVKRRIADGTIPSIKIGGARRISEEVLVSLIEGGPEEETKKIPRGSQFYWSQKDPNVAESIYKDKLKPGQIILDPFLGAGSSMYGVRNLDLKFVGVELNEMPIGIARFNALAITDERINNISNKIIKLEEKLLRLFEYKDETGKIVLLERVLYSSRDIKTCDIKLTFSSNIEPKNVSEIIEEHRKRYLQYEKIIKEYQNPELIKNSRIAIKSGMKMSDIFSPINFYVLNEMKKEVSKDDDLRFVLGACLHLLRFTDEKSQSQFPFWVPKSNILDRNVFITLQKKADGLRKLKNINDINLTADFKELTKKKGPAALLFNKPVQDISLTDIPDQSIDFVLTDPPYFDQVAYSEYLKIWEYFLSYKTNLKDEIIESQRDEDCSDEKRYLSLLQSAFTLVCNKMKTGAEAYIYFKDSKPDNIQKFLQVMVDSGFDFLGQEHVIKSKYTYKQNTSQKNTVTGDCIMKFTKRAEPRDVAEGIDPVKDKEKMDALISDYVLTYLTINGKASLGEIYDNGLIKVLYDHNLLGMISNSKYVTELIEVICDFNKENRTYYLKDRAINNQLYLGDCLETLRSMPDNSVDCCITDPPYNISNYEGKKEIGWYKSNSTWKESKKFNKINEKWDTFTDDAFERFTDDWLKEIKRVVKPNGNIAIFGSLHNIYKTGYLLEKNGLRIINSIVWYKRNAFPNITQRMFCESTEQIIWAVNNDQKTAKNWTFNYKEMKELNGGKQMRNMWDIISTPAVEKKHGKHPSQKPMDVIDRLVLALTNEGDIIIDPFIGSGTTAVSAKNNNRDYVGVDNSFEYIYLSHKRLGDISEGDQSKLF